MDYFPLLVAGIILLNTFSHFFLIRFFEWYNQDSRVNPSGKTLKVKYFSYILLLPPLAIIVAVLLVGLGLILQIFEKIKKK